MKCGNEYFFVFYQIEDQQNDMKEQRLEVENYKRLAVDFETKYRLQLSANQTTNMEKMSMKKVLRQAQDEVDYVKNQLKVLNDQIKFHKDQILVKENTLHQQEFRKIKHSNIQLKNKIFLFQSKSEYI